VEQRGHGEKKAEEEPALGKSESVGNPPALVGLVVLRGMGCHNFRLTVRKSPGGFRLNSGDRTRSTV
jgi:hypothetical protein